MCDMSLKALLIVNKKNQKKSQCEERLGLKLKNFSSNSEQASRIAIVYFDCLKA